MTSDTRPNPSEHIAAPDAVEFRSDRQTEKGPSSGRVVVRNGSQVAIRHSDTVEWFDVAALRVERLSTHHRGGKLWIME